MKLCIIWYKIVSKKRFQNLKPNSMTSPSLTIYCIPKTTKCAELREKN
uniref:Uncharacterized protein n=1 Tax=Arundo donax TaxID=35708 RepID=A0A0A9FTP5_ARUDO